MSPSKLRTGGYLAATLVMLCVAAMSWSGLYGFARVTLHWAPVPAGMVPVSLDVAALTCALLALDTVSKNEPATMFRFLTAALVGLSAFVNWRYRLSSHVVAEEVFFPAMSIAAYLMIDATIRKYRRDTRRGEVARQAPEPLTRYGLLVWIPGIGHPLRAFRAASAELGRRIPDSPPERATLTPSRVSLAPSQSPAIAIEDVSQSDAIRHAIEAAGSQDPGEIVAWLTEHGRPVARQRVSDVLRRDGLTPGRHRLEAIDGGADRETA
ncbi:MAG: DUF2637 domain-containing protein [Streptosporangiaceae bacterium]